MSRRYAVQVVGELGSNTQPTSPSVQSVSLVSSSSSASTHKPSSPRKFIVEAVPDVPAPSNQPSVNSSPSQSSPTSKPKPSPVVSKETTITNQPLTTQTLPQVLPQKDSPAEPADYLSQREATLQHLWQEQQLQKLPEQPIVITPKKEVSGSSINVQQKTQPTLKTELSSGSSLQKIESFYQKKKPQKKNYRHQENKLKKIIQKYRFVVAIFLAIVVSTGSMWFSLLAVKAEIKQTTNQAESLLEDLHENRLVSAKERLISLERKQSEYKQIYSLARPVVRVTQGEEKTTHIDRLCQTSSKGLEIVNSSLALYEDLDVGYRQFVGEEQGDSVETFTHLSGRFETLFTQLSQIQGEVQQLGNPYQLQVIADLDKKVTKDLPKLRRSVLAAQKISVVLPQLLGEDEERTYLVLLQNNAELRPTGGFIGSFALLKVKKGKLVDFKVEDVYEADGQLDGFVTPPEEIVQYLNEAQWYLRDVNWSPDFPTVAARAGWFIDKSIGAKVDGVIGINLNVAKELLRVTGPVEIVDYDEVITPDNLYQLAQTHSEINFFPGSNGKKDFLSAVATQILNKIFYGDTNKLALGESLLTSAEQSDLLASFSMEKVESVFTDLSWNGQVLTPGCPSPFSAENCFVDTVMQVEANVGVNKANQFVTRSIEQKSEILNDRVRHTRTIILKNNSDSEAWPAGKYKVYLRILTTEGSELRSLSIDDQPVDLTSVRTEIEAGKQVFGYFVEVPILSTKKISFFYETPLPDPTKTYALFEQKQSGTSGDEVVHVLDVGNREVSVVAPEPKITGRQLEFSSKRETHEFFGIQF